MAKGWTATLVLVASLAGSPGLAQPPIPIAPRAGLPDIPPPPPRAVQIPPGPPTTSNILVRYSQDPNDSRVAVLECKFGQDRTFSECVVNQSNPPDFASLAMVKVSQMPPFPTTTQPVPRPDGLYRITVAGGGAATKLTTPQVSAPPPPPPKHDPDFAKIGPCAYDNLSEGERQTLAEGLRTSGRQGFARALAGMLVKYTFVTAQCATFKGSNGWETALYSGSYLEQQSSLALLKESGLSAAQLNAAWKNAPDTLRAQIEARVDAQYHKRPLPAAPDLSPIIRALPANSVKPVTSQADALLIYYDSSEVIAFLIHTVVDVAV